MVGVHREGIQLHSVASPKPVASRKGSVEPLWEDISNRASLTSPGESCTELFQTIQRKSNLPDAITYNAGASVCGKKRYPLFHAMLEVREAKTMMKTAHGQFRYNAALSIPCAKLSTVNFLSLIHI